MHEQFGNMIRCQRCWGHGEKVSNRNYLGNRASPFLVRIGIVANLAPAARLPRSALASCESNEFGGAKGVDAVRVCDADVEAGCWAGEGQVALAPPAAPPDAVLAGFPFAIAEKPGALHEPVRRSVDTAIA